MRTLLKVTFDTEASNATITDGSLPKVLKDTMDRLKPEAAYFFTDTGNRGCQMVFDMKDPSEIPAIAEPFFLAFKAKVEFFPVMNIEDLQRGLKAAMKAQYDTVQ